VDIRPLHSPPSFCCPSLGRRAHQQTIRGYLQCLSGRQPICCNAIHAPCTLDREWRVVRVCQLPLQKAGCCNILLIRDTVQRYLCSDTVQRYYTAILYSDTVQRYYTAILYSDTVCIDTVCSCDTIDTHTHNSIYKFISPVHGLSHLPGGPPLPQRQREVYCTRRGSPSQLLPPLRPRGGNREHHRVGPDCQHAHQVHRIRVPLRTPPASGLY
jgi:hypothetical protein